MRLYAEYTICIISERAFSDEISYFIHSYILLSRIEIHNFGTFDSDFGTLIPVVHIAFNFDIASEIRNLNPS